MVGRPYPSPVDWEAHGILLGLGAHTGDPKNATPKSSVSSTYGFSHLADGEPVYTATVQWYVAASYLMECTVNRPNTLPVCHEIL